MEGELLRGHQPGLHAGYQIKYLSCHNPQASPGEPELQGGQESGAGDVQGAQAAVQLQEHQGDSLKCVYFGQSGRPIHARMEDHKRGIKSGDTSCPLFRHHLQEHQGDDKEAANFQDKVVCSARTNLSRMLLEAEVIQEGSKQGNLLNNKSEYRGTKLIRMVPEVRRM